mmetsp:Transcript_39255/g.37673  ORF Transcript_39255/g.37673 Transcript_39255/m.37673 type:complete len:291 (-) Transcript_39255:46-918(-)
MHFKYSAIMNVVFVTFMYGLAIPVLFLIAFAFFVIHYIAEKLCITYFFKKPPMFDEKLNASALDMMKWAPAFMMLFGYWVLGNRQIFYNRVVAKTYRSDPTLSTHHPLDIELDQSFPLLIMGLLILLALFFDNTCQNLLVKAGLMSHDKEIEVDEKLGKYHECLSLLHRKAWRVEELHMRKHFGISTINDALFQNLQSTDFTGKKIKNCHNYQIVTNPKYAADFQYTPVEMRDTLEEQENSDFVLKILNLPYFPTVNINELLEQKDVAQKEVHLDQFDQVQNLLGDNESH